MPRARTTGERDEQGAITLAVTMLAVGFLILGGLVVDGGRQINAKIQARAVAEEAARAGASQTDVNEADAVLVPGNVKIAVADYCEEAMANDADIVECAYSGSGEYTGGGVGGRLFPWVEVTVTAHTDTFLLGMIGVGGMDSTVSARANAIEGVEDPLNDPGLPTLDPTGIPPSPVDPSYPTVTTTVPPTVGPTPSQYWAGESPCASSELVATDMTIICNITEETGTTLEPPTDPPEPTGPTTTTSGTSTPTTSTSGTSTPTTSTSGTSTPTSGTSEPPEPPEPTSETITTTKTVTGTTTTPTTPPAEPWIPPGY